ncbi:hypothetical protein ACFQZV_00600 [Microbacterium koreense]|uniref:HTH merR-type domain-containing protein n=1 Tax=Microbacterium koreense TaxID=323761 RepID=A0ABW2ZMR6_9MICO
MDAHVNDVARYSTSHLADASGYSVQQVRDLEHLGVIPPALRQPNGYRQFTGTHAIALRSYPSAGDRSWSRGRPRDDA